jgi:MOSC domain-containing protein YiiM
VNSPRVVAVHRDPTHRFSKISRISIRLLQGLGVEGDAHLGETVQHRSRVAADPTQPNLRQVHLMAVERQAELVAAGFAIEHGQLGENVTTAGIDLFALPVATQLRFQSGAVLCVTGLRNPCKQLDAFAPGLMLACLPRDAQGAILLRAGIMAIVSESGELWPGDSFEVVLPELPHQQLQRV